MPDLELHAARFPSLLTSRDGRNFPQFAPTTAEHCPSVNCFASWLPALASHLQRLWQHPVFIANEGWGGITTEGYLRMMREDAGWQARMRLLQPSLWLLHLGVNDERAGRTPAAVAADLEAIVDLLIRDWNAEPTRIRIAKPCFDFFANAEPLLRDYCREIDRLISARGLAAGPDFFTAYATDRQKWYGADPVHPNPDGMQRMAALWAQTLEGEGGILA